MSYKKPTPILSEQNAKICVVCGQRSYSANGIHPQCCVIQADAPRTQWLKAKKEAEAKKNLGGKKKPQDWDQQKCPKCHEKVHVRRKACDCGFEFSK